MKLDKILLQNFRGYKKQVFTFGEMTVVVGDNGTGKSNLMEAIYLLSVGKSFRADRDEEMIRYGENLALVTGHLELGDELRVILAERKKFEVNGIARRMIDFVGKLRAVMFSPTDMELVTGSPGVRRRYLDFVISQVDREYRRCLISYEKGLRQRNKLLDMIREGMASRSQLYFWDKLLIKNGEYLTLKRGEYLDEENLTYDKSVISQMRLAQYEMEEVAAATTLVGPHRDDFVITSEGKDISKYGSRGRQRMAVLSLKKKEIQYLGGEPLLLLDDIFSELDHKHREEVTSFVKNYAGQVIMTSADEHLVPKDIEVNIIHL